MLSPILGHRRAISFAFQIVLVVALPFSFVLAFDNPQNPAPKPLAYFTDIAKKAGLSTINTFGGITTKKYIIETTGTGFAISDADTAGWPYIFAVKATFFYVFPPAPEPPPNH